MYRILYLLLCINISGAFAQTETKITPEDGVALELFGGEVSISGNLSIVGKRLGEGGRGSAYIFERQGSNWVEIAKLTASDGAESDRFGGSVSILGDIAIVGASRDDDNGDDSGSAYIFERQGSSWVEVAKLKASNATESDFFGGSVSISDDFAVVGADGYANNGDGSGAVYIFERQILSNNWTEVAKLTASDGAAGDRFGDSVSISDDFVIVGAYLDDDNGVDSGAVYFFERQILGDDWD